MPDLRRVCCILVAIDGGKVEYVTTDISDPTMAQALGLNLVPRLAEALPAPGRPSVVERA